jgi:hypothetical protein
MINVLKRGVALIIGLSVIYLVLIYGASESGEVVQLITADQQGEEVTTRLWVADYEESMWLRADQSSGWYQRLILHDPTDPAILIRGAQRYSVYAVPEPQTIGELNQLMADKYGLGDRVVALLMGSPDAGVAVRLVLTADAQDS